MMRKQNNIEIELNTIRAKLYEEIKGMPPSEMTAYMKAKVAPIEKKYGIHTVNEIKAKQRRVA